MVKIPGSFKFKQYWKNWYGWVFVVTILIAASAYTSYQYYLYIQKVAVLQGEKTKLAAQLSTTQKEFTALKKEDQVVLNKKNKEEITAIQSTYKDAVTTYETMVNLQDQKVNVEKERVTFAGIVKQLSEKNYASAQATLKTFSATLASKQPSAGGINLANVTASNAPPGSGYNRQRVSTSIGEYVVDIIAGDLGSTRVIVDTASDGDCRDNCPVLSLGEYVSRNGAFAAVNGSYFCPATYPSCAGKTNSFDTLAMNKNKKYINADNNVYSTVPAVIFGGSYVRFVGQSLEWGRDTGVDGVLANQPLVLAGGNVIFGGDGDPKKGAKGSRSFVGSKGSTVYIGVVHNATVAEVGHALKGLGLENALNLDSGGSTALWYGGYKAGPGRAIPNAILFVRK